MEKRTKSDVVIFNSAAALVVTNVVDSFEDGVKYAQEIAKQHFKLQI